MLYNISWSRDKKDYTKKAPYMNPWNENMKSLKSVHKFLQCPNMTKILDV
jgi:hypothetical protein